MKKFLSTLLALTLLLGLAVPTTTVSAAKETIWVDNWDLVSTENLNDPLQVGSYLYEDHGCFGLKPVKNGEEYAVGKIEFTVDVSKAGLYELTIVYCAKTGSATRKGELYINGEHIQQMNFTMMPDWYTPSEEVLFVTLEAGENTVLLTSPTDYDNSSVKTPNIYAIKYNLKKASTTTTTPTPTATPKPTATPAPTATPKPTATPAPTTAPKPTVAPTVAPTTAPEEVKPSQKDIVNALYALEDGQSLEGEQTLTGVIKEFKYTYNPNYSTIQLTIIVDGMTDKPVVCYKLGGEGIDKVEVGDTITVTGQLKNYKGTYEFNGCTLKSYRKPILGGEYVVQKGDTLYKIARAAGVTLKELIEANNIENPSEINRGAKLIIPTITVKRHMVVKGDTLYKIAKANGCKVSDLVKLNAIENPDLINVGDAIVLP